ncbi:HlyD family type I secretion periplasmic adaptor subunit [Roseibium sediminicola]|uniref:Membrane fusion protein (MFP) family protein n=1 Tax=Roseibium sediminicola TaxID=2933272 RepID=A0ABT0H2D6_9HYPH|nr:HlyD family type I secretion periplasmic adaptor subunit [Roseibium sp. CAU 1639]MCK7615846.1 HlyD family type I secretion periplasmic adaptor subunit [Roseibium sp. CAU 1639]
MSSIAHAEQDDWFATVPRSIFTHTLIGVFLLVFCVGGFAAWAFSAPLAAAVIASGTFVATGQNKKVQHYEGGIIKAILVQEGARVHAGEPIVQLDETVASANERQLWLKLARLEAINARLRAEYLKLDEVVFPEILKNHAGDEEIATILAGQKLNFLGSRTKLMSDISILEGSIQGIKHRRESYAEQRSSMVKQLELLREEHEGKKHLFEKGLVLKPTLNAMERAIAEAEGQIGRLSALMREADSQISQHKEQVRQTQAAYHEKVLDDLQTIEAELDSAREQSRKARNVLERAVIQAPVSGTIVRMHYHTAGGVIESGKTIVEILPTDAPLIIEALVARTDIDSVHVGQPATVRLSALNQRTTPVLNGKVQYVSADAITDNTTGIVREVYVTRIDIAPGELRRVKDFVPTPGMPAEIMIQTHERTFMQYLTKPIADSMSRAFREE